MRGGLSGVSLFMLRNKEHDTDKAGESWMFVGSGKRGEDKGEGQLVFKFVDFESQITDVVHEFEQ